MFVAVRGSVRRTVLSRTFIYLWYVRLMFAVVRGSVGRIVLSRRRYHLLVEGYGLAAVMGAPGIDGTRTRSNHIIEVRCLPALFSIDACYGRISTYLVPGKFYDAPHVRGSIPHSAPDFEKNGKLSRIHNPMSY